MAKNESGVPGTALDGLDNAKPYSPPRQNDDDVSFIEGFGTPTWPSSEKKINSIPEQQKKSGC
jgi:hypothetical protein